MELTIMIMAVVCLLGEFIWMQNKINKQEKTILSMTEEKQTRIDKIQAVLLALDKEFSLKAPDRGKHYLCGLMDALEWDIGVKKDEEFVGTVILKKWEKREAKK
jgi:hypothetical protein